MSVNYYNILIADDEEIEREALKMIVGTSGLPFSSIYEAKKWKGSPGHQQKKQD